MHVKGIIGRAGVQHGRPWSANRLRGGAKGSGKQQVKEWQEADVKST